MGECGILWGRGWEFPPSYRDGPLARNQALSFHEGLATPHGTQETVSGCIQGNQAHDETQGRNKAAAENNYVSETPHNRKALLET